MSKTPIPAGDGIVILAFGPQPMDFIGKAAKFCGKDAVLDPDLARMAGANFAIGIPTELASLRERLAAGAVVMEAERHQDSGLSENATKWLATGERGLSSNTLFFYATGFDARDEDWGDCYPRDPDDLRRCRLLIEQCPELASCLPRVAASGPEWAALVARWDDVCTVMDEECPRWRERQGIAPRTYSFMRQLFEGAKPTTKEEA